jgi:hypothetical protein
VTGSSSRRTAPMKVRFAGAGQFSAATSRRVTIRVGVTPPAPPRCRAPSAGPARLVGHEYHPPRPHRDRRSAAGRTRSSRSPQSGRCVIPAPISRYVSGTQPDLPAWSVPA